MLRASVLLCAVLSVIDARTFRIGVIFKNKRWLEAYNMTKLVVEEINNSTEVLPNDTLELVYDPAADNAAEWSSSLPYKCYNNHERFDLISKVDDVTFEVTCDEFYEPLFGPSKFPSNYTRGNFSISLFLQNHVSEALALTMGVSRGLDIDAGSFPHNASLQSEAQAVDVIVTSTLSAHTAQFLDYMSMIKMPVVGWISNAGTLVNKNVRSHSGWLQRVTQNDDHSQMAVISFLQRLGVERVGVVYLPTDDAGIAVRDRLAVHFRVVSFELPDVLLEHALSDKGSELYKSVADTIRESGVRVLVIWPSWAIQGTIRWLGAHNIIGDPRYTVIMSTDAKTYAYREFILASNSTLLSLPLNSSITGIETDRTDEEAIAHYRSRMVGLFYASAVNNDDATPTNTTLRYKEQAPAEATGVDSIIASLEDMVRTAAMGIDAAVKWVNEENAQRDASDQLELTREHIRDQMRTVSIYSSRYGNLTFLPNGDPDVPFAIVNFRPNAEASDGLEAVRVGHFAPSFIQSEQEVLPLEMTEEQKQGIRWADGIVGYQNSPFVPVELPLAGMFELLDFFGWSRVGVVINAADPEVQSVRDAFATRANMEAVFYGAPDQPYDEVYRNSGQYDSLAERLMESDLRIIVLWPSWNAEPLLRWLTIKGIIGNDRFTFILAPTATRVASLVYGGTNDLMDNSPATLQRGVGMFSLTVADEVVLMHNWRSDPSNTKVTPVPFATLESTTADFKVFNDAADVVWSDNQIGLLNRPLSTPVVIKKTRPMDSGVRVTLLALSLIGIVACVGTFFFLVAKRHLRYIRMSSWKINSVVLFGLIVACIGVIMLGIGSEQVADYDESLGYIPFNVDESAFLGVCNARIWLLPIAFTLTFGGLFSKTFRVWRIFVNHQFNVRSIGDIRLLGMVGLLLFVDVLTMAAFHISSSFERTLTVENEVPFPIEGNLDATEQFYYEHCSADGLDTFMGLFIVTKGLLLVFGLWMASETRNVEIPALNDSRSIATCVYVVAQVSLIMMPVSFVFDENDGQQSRYLLVGLCVLTMVYSVLGLLFVPKIYNVFTGQAEKLTTVMSMNSLSGTNGTASVVSGTVKRTATLRTNTNTSSTAETGDVELQIVQSEAGGSTVVSTALTS
ncbi:MAG: hypothetical protein MHM6MM_005903 [Cercozoa sp. M6MM]